MEELDLGSIGTFVALGGTFAAHKRFDAEQRWPFLWTVPAASVVPEGEPIRIPPYVEQASPGPELAVVIGDVDEPVWRASEAEVRAAIAGFTVSNDVKNYGEFPAYPYEGVDERVGRGYHVFPTFTPTLSRYAPVAPEAVADARMEAFVDGELVVEASTAEMAWSVPEMVAHVSKIVPLESGDVVSLGDPTHPETFLDDADEVVCRIEGVGELANPITREQ